MENTNIDNHKFTKHINDFFINNIHKFINNTLYGNPDSPIITLDVNDILGCKTDEYLSIYLGYILYRKELDIDQLTKFKTKLINTNIKSVINLDTSEISIQINDTIFNYKTDKTIFILNNKYHKIIKELSKIDVSFDNDLVELFEDLEDKITDKLMDNTSSVTHEQIEKTYIKFLTNILIKHLK